MFILKSKHEKIVTELKQRIAQAEDLHKLLEKIIDKTGIPMPEGGFHGGAFLTTLGGSVAWEKMSLPDNIAQYVDDYFGGKVIKQEATKVVILEKDGERKEAFTKQKPDKGFSYKLVRL